MSTPAGCKPVGRWRIVKADIWDRAYLTSADRRQIAFGAPQACLDIEYSGSSIEFHLAGFDEMDEVSGDGSAELLDDGTIEVEFAYHNGDEALLKASGRAIR
jgi:hypothetical protein